jgi:hypothetical protein
MEFEFAGGRIPASTQARHPTPFRARTHQIPLAFLIDEFSEPESESWHGPGRTTRLAPTAGHS